MFKNYISDMSIEREVELVIDLVLGTSHVLMTPYRMWASELSEMKKQLENLLGKKIIYQCYWSRRRMVA